MKLWIAIAWLLTVGAVVGIPVRANGEDPTTIGYYRNLFVGDYLISSKSSTIERQVHEPTRHAQNPLIGPTNPWEFGYKSIRDGTPFPCVARDESTGKFRLWYAGYTRYTMPSGVEVRFPACYAESDDGLTWVKPNLGLHSYNGSTDNNIIIPAGNIYGVIDEPNDVDPNRRYKAMVWHEPEYADVEGYFIYTSPDAIHWTRETPLSTPVLDSIVHGSGTVGDTSWFRWDPKLEKYVGDVKLFDSSDRRISGHVESDYLVNWTTPVVTIEPDAYDSSDTQIYQHRGFVYENQWLGLARIYHEDHTPSHKQTTVELTSSNDGRNWDRVGTRGVGQGRQEFMSVDYDGSWDDDYHDPCTPIRVGNELWIYYRSSHMGILQSDLQTHQIGLATLRLDGFASLDAGELAGTVTTVPLAYNGELLTINADIAEGGYVKAALLDASGNVLDGYSLSDCNPVTGDVLEARITWQNHGVLVCDETEGLRLRFELKDAKLYSFSIQPIPEPGTLTLLGIGVLQSVVYVWRKAAKAAIQ